MTKKSLVIMLTTFIILASVSSCIGSSVNHSIKDHQEELISSSDNDINESGNYTFLTFGPAFKISEITFHNGPEDKIKRIERFLNRWKLRPMIPFVLLIFEENQADLELCNISFTATYNQVPEKSKYTYATAYGSLNETEGNETTIINEKHSITVEGFNGFFGFLRPRILFFKPAQFILSGICKNITVNPI